MLLGGGALSLAVSAAPHLPAGILSPQTGRGCRQAGEGQRERSRSVAVGSHRTPHTLGCIGAGRAANMTASIGQEWPGMLIVGLAGSVMRRAGRTGFRVTVQTAGLS